MRSPPKDRLFFIRKLLEKSKKCGRHIFVAVLTYTHFNRQKRKLEEAGSRQRLRLACTLSVGIVRTPAHFPAPKPGSPPAEGSALAFD